VDKGECGYIVCGGPRRDSIKQSSNERLRVNIYLSSYDNKSNSGDGVRVSPNPISHLFVAALYSVHVQLSVGDRCTREQRKIGLSFQVAYSSRSTGSTYDSLVCYVNVRHL